MFVWREGLCAPLLFRLNRATAMRRLAKWLCAGAALAALLTPATARAAWKQVGGFVVEAGLDGPAGGGVAWAAFSADGSQIFVQTDRGALWESADDGASWRPRSFGESLPPLAETPSAEGQAPAVEPQASLSSRSAAAPDFALGERLYRRAAGEDWRPIEGLGSSPRSLAYHPLRPEVVLAATAAGLWRSADEGRTWISLNDRLPNFPAARFAAVDGGLRIATAFGEASLLSSGSGLWIRLADGGRAQGELLGSASRLPAPTAGGLVFSNRAWRNGVPASPDLTRCRLENCGDPAAHSVTAATAAGDRLYAGTSDGLLWTSAAGASWRALEPPPGVEPGAGVAALWADPQRPESAAVVFDRESGARVFRTLTGGQDWEDVTNDLPPGRLTALAADGDAGALYVAGGDGVFYSPTSMREPAPAGSWQAVPGLPPARVDDLLADGRSGRLYAAVAGYGVFRTRAPAVVRSLRLVNAADLSSGPTAPGGLLTLLGGPIGGARVSGREAPLLAVSEESSQVQAPYDLEPGLRLLQVQTRQGARALPFEVTPTAPAIFSDEEQPLIFDAGTGRFVDLVHPARPGRRLLVFVAGLGQVEPLWPAGLPAPLENPPRPVAKISARLDGAAIEVVEAALAPGYIGAYLVEIELPPALSAGSAELIVEADGRASKPVRLLVDP